jgi:hypothetical protein
LVRISPFSPRAKYNFFCTLFLEQFIFFLFIFFPEFQSHKISFVTLIDRYIYKSIAHISINDQQRIDFGEQIQEIISQCISSIKRDNPNISDDIAQSICSSLKEKGELTRKFSEETKILAVGEYNTKTFPTIAIKANKILKYRTTPEGVHYIYIPSETLEKAAKTMNGQSINWEHENKKRKLGTFENAHFKNNKLYGELKVTDSEYINWINSLKEQGKIPNVSVEFSNSTNDRIKIDDGFIEICYNLNFLGIALCERGICSDKDGCGIRDMSCKPKRKKKEPEMKSEAETFWLNAVDSEILELVIKKGFNPLKSLAVWNTQYVNNLPDSAFAVIMPGGELDDEKKTKPRTLRKLPYIGADGKVDLPHLRNALARVSQIDAPQSMIDKARALLQRVAREELPGYEEREGSSKAGKEDRKNMTEEKTPCDKELSELKEKVDEISSLSKSIKKLSEFEEEASETLKKMSDFLSKFEPPKEEEKKKELSTEEMITKAVESAVQKVLSVTIEQQEKNKLIKQLAETTGIEESGLNTLTVEQLKNLKVDVKIPSTPRRTMLTDGEGNNKTIEDLSKREKDVLSAQSVRKMLGMPLKTQNEVEYYLSAKDNLPENWYRPRIGSEVS